jgi:flavin-dependent dehydrogenase
MQAREVDYVIIGAGMAGMAVKRTLQGESAVLLDPRPGRYKIGESVIPQHFADPLMRGLIDIVWALPSTTPKEATIFVSDESMGWFPPFHDAPYAIHLDRREFEEATAKYFGTEIVRERVDAVDVETGHVTTDAGSFVARKLIIDCSGPARIVARALGLAREVWPVWASWAYHDVLETDVERFWGIVERKEKAFMRFDNMNRRLVPGALHDPFCPSHATILTQVGDGTWTWQIPLWKASLLSVGVVSRHGPVSEDEYVAITKSSIAPQFTTRLRPWDRSGPHNSFHVRNRFAWTSDRFAGEKWALVGDAAFFGDPVYSVGTGLATNHAIQLGRLLTEGGWSAARAEAFHRHTAHLYERAKRAYDHWYFGNVMASQEIAIDIQTDFLNGHVFQVQSSTAYADMWDVASPADKKHQFGYAHEMGAEVTEALARLLEEGGQLVGWKLDVARSKNAKLRIEWSRPDAPPLEVSVEAEAAGRPYYGAASGLGISYRKSKTAPGNLDGQGQALMEALVKLASTRADQLKALLVPPAGSQA